MKPLKLTTCKFFTFSTMLILLMNFTGFCANAQSIGISSSVRRQLLRVTFFLWKIHSLTWILSTGLRQNLTQKKSGNQKFQAISLKAVCTVLLFIISTTAFSQTKTRVTGAANWNTASTWIQLRTGTVVFTNASTIVTGTGTLFTTELQVGDILMMDASPATIRGTIASIQSNTSLTLVANATQNVSTAAYGRQKVPGSTDDIQIGNTAINSTVNVALDVNNATVKSITFISQGTSNTLDNGTNNLTVTGDVTVNNSTSGTIAWNLNAATASVGGNVTITAGNTGAGTRIAKINITSGTLTITGNLIYNSIAGAVDAQSVLDLSGGTSSVNIGGTISLTGAAIGTLTPGTQSIVTFTTPNNTIPGGTAIAYNNVNLSQTAGTLTASGTIAVNGTLTTNATTLDLVTYALTTSLNAPNVNTIKTQNISATPIPSGMNWGGTIMYNSASPQTIVTGNYTNLDGTGGARTLGTTIGISGTFTTGAGVYTVASSTVDYNGTGNQTITPLTYNILSISNTGTKTISSGIVTATLSTTSASILTLSGGTLSIAATQTINGTFNQTGGTFLSAFTVTIAGTFNQSGGTFHLASAIGTNPTDHLKVTGVVNQSGGTMNIKDYATCPGIFNQTGSSALFRLYGKFAPSTGSTFNSTAGTVQFTGNTNGNFAVGTFQFTNIIVDAGVDPGFSSTVGSMLNISGDFTNNNSTLVNTTSSTFNFNGTGNQTITSASTLIYLGHVTINKAGGTLILASNVGVAGNWTNNGGAVSGGANTVKFSGLANTIGGTSSTTFPILTFPSAAVYTMSNNNSSTGLVFEANALSSSLTHTGGATLTVNGNVTINQPTSSGENTAWNINAGSATVTGNVTIGGTNTTTSRISKVVVTTGSLSIAGDLVYNSSSTTAPTAVIDLSGGAASLNLAGAVTLTNGTGTLTPGTSSTTTFNGTGAQTITTASAITYNNIIVNKSSGSTTLGGAASVANVTLTQGLLSLSTNTLTVTGSFTNNGGGLTAGSGTITFAGTSSQSIGGSLATSFHHLTVNNATGLTLSNNQTVNGTLTFTSGKITTSSYTLTCGATSTVSGAGASTYVNGNLALVVSVGATSKSFFIGGPSYYRPIDVVFTGVTTGGTITAFTTAGDHPNIGSSNLNASLTVNRYFTLSNSGVVLSNYSAAFTFVSSDLDGGVSTNVFEVRQYTGGSWLSPAVGTRTATSTQATGITSFGDFQIGQYNGVPTLTSLNPTSGIPGQTLDIVLTGTGFVSGYSSVNVGADMTINTTTFNSSTSITINVTIGSGATLGTRNISVTNSAPGGGTSGVQIFTINTITSWKGTTSTAWNVATNWTSGVPTASTDVIIGNSSFTGSFQPAVTAAAVCKSLTLGGSVVSTLTVSTFPLTVSGDISITTNGTLSHSSSGIIQLTGNWSNTGTFTAAGNSSPVVFAGTSIISGTTSFGTITVNGAATVTQNSEATTSIGVITINSGGTFTLNGGTVATAGLTTSGVLAVTAGTITTSNTLTINSGATLNQSGGLIHLASAIGTNPTENLVLTGTINQSGGTLAFKDYTNSTGGIINQTGAGALIKVYHDWKAGAGNVLNSTAGTVQFSGNSGAGPDFSIGTNQFSNIIVDAGADPGFSNKVASRISISGDFTNNNSSLVNTTSSTFTFNGTGTQNIITNSTGAIFGHVTINKSGGTLFLASNVGVAGNWTNNGGTVSGGANTVTFSGLANTIGGTASTTFPGIALTDLAVITMNNNNSCTSLTIPISSGVTTFTQSGNTTLTVTGNVTINQPTAATTSGWFINAGIATVNGNINIGGITGTSSRVAKIAVTTGTLTVEGDVIYNSASATAPSAIIDLTGGAATVNFKGSVSLANGSGTLSPGTSSNVYYNGTGAQTIGGGSSISYYNLNFVKTSGVATLGSNVAATNVFLTQGQLSGSGSYIMTVSGDWTNNGGTATNAPIVTFTGTGKNIAGTGTTDFGALTFNSGSSYTINNTNTCTGLTLPAGSLNTTLSQNSASNLTVNGNVTLGQPLSSGITNKWAINAGTATVTGNINIGGTNTTLTRIAKVAITSGTLNVNGNVVYNSSATTAPTAVVDMSGGAGQLNLMGNLTLTNGTGTLTPGTSSTVNFNGTLAQSVSFASAIKYNNIYSNNPATVTVSGAVTATSVTGDIRIQTGIFSNGGFAIGMATGKTFEVVNGATFKLTGTSGMVTGTSIIKTFGATSTVEYAGAAQTVSSEMYGHLTLSGSAGAVIKTMPNTAMTIAGNLTSNLGTATSVSYTALADYTIGGSVSIGASTTFDGSSFTHSITGNWVNNGTYTASTSTITMTGASTTISGSGTLAFNNLTFTGTNITAGAVNISVAGNLLTTGVGSFTHASGGGFTMSGTSKTITGTGFAFNDLTLNGTISTTAVLNVAGNLAAGSGGSFTGTAGSVTMSGTSKTITATGIISLYNLTVTGTVTTATNLTISSVLAVTGSLTASAGTTTFTNTSSLSGTANLYNVTINGTSLQLTANSVLGIAGTYTITSGTLDVTSAIPNTVNFNGILNRTIASGTFHHLIFTGNTNSAGGSITVNGDITISVSTTFAASTYAHYIKGNWINNGTFTAGTSTVEFNGPNDATVTGATTFNIITINKSASTNVVDVLSNVSVATINMTLGKVTTGTNTLTITTTRTGAGIILGYIQRTHSFTTGVAYEFEGQNNTITFTAASGVTSILVKVSVGTIADFPFGGSINRLYDITIPAGTYTAILRLHYEDAELNGNTESAISLWKYSGSWVTVGKSNSNTTSNWVEQTGLTNIVTRWTFSDDNNVMSWNGSVSTNWNTAANWTAIQGSTGSVPSANDIVEIGVFTYTNAPTISTAAVAKSIVFGSAQAATLTFGAGGSLTAQGNISGTWSANATHTINTNNQNITVNGDIVLSDGTSNHIINLNIGTGTVTITGSLTESGGANITFSGAGSLVIGNNFNYTSGTFTKSTGTVTFNGAGAQAVAAVNYQNLVVNKTGIATISSAATISGDLTITAGELDINAASTITGNVAIASGAILVSGNVTNTIGGNWSNSGTFTPSTGTITLNGAGTQTVSATPFNNLTINKSTGTAILGNLTISGNISVLSGTLDLSTYTANRNLLGGSFSLSNGTTLYLGGAANFPSNYATYTLGATSTVNYNGAAAQTVAGITYGNLVFTNGTSNAKTLAAATTVNGDLTINSGATFSAGAYTLSIAGNWTNSGTFTPSTSTVIFSGASKSISGNTIFNKLTVSGTYSVPGNNITMNGLFYIPSGGSVASTTGTLTISGDLTNNGTLTSTGTTTFTGTGAQTLANVSATINLNVVNFNGTVSPTLASTFSPTYATVNINNTGGVTSNVGWTVTTAFNVAVGASFNGNTGSHNFNGSFTNNGTVSTSGTFNFNPTATQTIKLQGTSFSSTGTLIFAGSGAISVTGTPATLTNITISNTNGVTPASNWTMGGNFLVNSNAVFNAGTYSYTVGGNLLSSGTLNGGTSIFTMSSGAGILSGSTTTTFYDLVISGTVSATADYNVSHNFTNNGSYDGTSAILNMTGSAAATIGGTAATYNLAQLSIRKSGGATTTLAHNILAVTRLDVTTGVLDASTYTITQDAGGGTFSLLPNTTFKIGGTNTLPTFNTYSFDSTSTVEYYGGVQSISNATSYGNLVMSAAGNKTAAAALTVLKNITLTNATFIGGSYTHLVGGNWNMSSGSFTNTGTTITLNGTMTQTVTSTGAFNNLTVNKASAGVTLGGTITVSGTLTFTLGIITTGSYSLISTTTGTISGAAQATGWVNGNLQKSFSNGTNVAGTYQVGGTTNYSPATLTFASVTGGGGAVTVKSTDGSHPNLSGSTITADKNIPRYWTVTNTGSISFTTYTISLTWNTAENYAGLNTTLLSIGKYTSSAWSYPTITGTPTTSNVQANAITNMGDFVVGEKCDIPATFSYTATPYCSNAGTASVTYSGGGQAGAFTFTPAGLSINASTGQVNLTASTVGTYTVTNTTTGTSGCTTLSTATITITAAPSATISYSASPYCSSAGTVTVTRTGTSGGSYSSTAGLTINSTTGAITTGSSTAGTYTVTYTIAAAGGCSQYTTTASVTITAAPAATISYAGSPYCTDGGTASVTFSGTSGGTYSSTAGLSINASTGAVTLATCTDGTYTVTYTVAAAGGCSLYTTTASITINTSGKWSGAVNTNWNNASNWQCGVVPTSTVNVTIPGGLSNYPTINSGTSAINNLTILSGGTLTVTATLQIAGTISNSGTFTASAGTIEMNGTGAQTIYANTYSNLILTGSGTTKTAGGALVINGTLTVNSNVTMDMATYDLSGSITTITNSGTIKTQSASGTPLPIGKTWTGTLEYNRSAASQTIVAGAYNNLKVSGGNTKTLGGAISLVDSLTLGASTTFALSSYDVTLKSTASAVARIANTPSTSDFTYGTGRFIVERYVPGRRKYRLFTSSVTSSPNATLVGGEEALSIWGNWQNSGNNVTANIGTIITGGSSADGFDQQTTNASMYTYDDVNKRYVAYSTANGKNTKYTPLKAGIAYYLFVYGDRTNTIFTSTPKYSTISSRGKVLTGDQAYTTSSTIPLTGVTNRFTMLGNPFASPIDWATVSRTNIANTFWGWDPNLSSTGGYVTVSTTGTVTLVSPFSGTVGLNQYIQPGQGFFVKTTGASPTMTIRESDKVSNFNSIAFRGSGTGSNAPNSIPLIAVNLLYTSAGNPVLADGTLAAFDPGFSNSVGNEDGTKIINSAEGIAVQNGTDLLSIEARQMPADLDTIFLNVARLTKPQYTLQIFTNQMETSGLQPYLVDNYLNTVQSLSLTDTNRIVFNVTSGVPASSAANRFSIVFHNIAILPITFTAINAIQKNKDVEVDWSVAEESSTRKYEIERSTNGVSFSKIGEVSAKGINGNQSYQWLDIHPVTGKNFYRIRGVDASGRSIISKIAWVNIEETVITAVSSIKVFPNPVTDQKINLQLNEIPKGEYIVQLINAQGQLVFTKTIDHNGGTGSQVITISEVIAKGLYYIQLVNGTVRYRQSIVIN